jgi:hypothetical protein
MHTDKTVERPSLLKVIPFPSPLTLRLVCVIRKRTYADIPDPIQALD